jgi:hypothetical protein
MTEEKNSSGRTVVHRALEYAWRIATIVLAIWTIVGLPSIRELVENGSLSRIGAAVALGIPAVLAVLGLASWSRACWVPFWHYARWTPTGFAAWMRWRRVDNEVRSRLEGLEPVHWESLVASVRKGEPYQGGRRKVRRADAEKYINSRSRVGTAGWSISWLAGSLTALSDAGLVSFGQVSPGVFLVRIFRACGSDDTLAEVLDAKLVKKRVWTPGEQVVEEQG